MISKKGSGNLEMVISFIFFLGFVLFLFLFLRPEDTTTLSGAVISELHDSFELETNTNLSTLFLKSNFSGSESCFTLDLPDSLFKYDIDNTDSYVALLSGAEPDSSLNNELLSISNDDKFFRVFISPEFNDDVLTGCGELHNFELGSIAERQVISYGQLLAMKQEYDSDYESLRVKLGVPSIYDFAIIPEDMPELSMVPELGIPTSTDVMARDFVFEVLREDGTLNNQRINFRIW